MFKRPFNKSFLIFIAVFFCAQVYLILSGEGCAKKRGAIEKSSLDYHSDPFFANQWYLNPNISNGWDIRVTPVWASGNRGQGVIVAVLDEGMDLSHPDLIDNAVPSLSWNFSNPESQTDVSNGYGHGTAVMGVIGGRDENNMGIKGVAPQVSLAGFNVLTSGLQTDNVISQGLNRNTDKVGVYNSSFGPRDSTGEFTSMSSLIRSTLGSAINSGRGGKGSVFAWANGNGGRTGEMSSYDGSVNFYGVIPACAVDQNGVKTDYSEFGSNIWVCAPGGGKDFGIATTDKPGVDGINSGKSEDIDKEQKSYTMNFMGTSASAPILTGVIALMEKANPNLSWRDIKWILAKAARRPPNVNSFIDGYENDFNLENLAGLFYSSGYGFGLLDATKAVELAASWKNVGPLHTVELPGSTAKSINKSLCDNCFVKDTQVISSVSGEGVTRIEYVELELTIKHGNWGDLLIALSHEGIEGSLPHEAALIKSSPEQTSSTLAIPHPCYKIDTDNKLVQKETCVEPSSTGFFRFGIARHLGENPKGSWTIFVKDTVDNSKIGTFVSWKLKFYGE
jgi:kexin